MNRFECMQRLASRLEHELVILSLGASVDEWYNAAPHMRSASLFQQQLGCVTPQAFGVAVGLPHRRIVSLDTDSDGLPDVWEAVNGLYPNSDADGAGDLDGDGATNAAEFLANTDPRDPASLLTITEVDSDGPDLLLSFSSARGMRYRLEESLTSPEAPWKPVLEDIPANGPETTLRIQGGNGQIRAFYRVIVQP